MIALREAATRSRDHSVYGKEDGKVLRAFLKKINEEIHTPPKEDILDIETLFKDLGLSYSWTKGPVIGILTQFCSEDPALSIFLKK